MARLQLSEELKKALLDKESLPRELRVRGHVYTPQNPVTAGYKGAIWKIADEHGRPRAAKLAIYEDYQDRSFLQEVYRATKLEDYPQFAKFIDADVVDLSFSAVGTVRLVCFVETWVEGYDLPTFLVKHGPVVNSSFLIMYVRGLCGALSALKAQQLRHDDLHAGNVMLEQPAPGSIDEVWAVKVVDMGSLKPADSAIKKPKDDHRHFVDHLVLIINHILARKQYALWERLFINKCIGLVRSMLDEDASVGLRDPKQIWAHFELAYSRALSPQSATPPSLLTPFEYISAEHIADDRLLVQIFADSCPWLDKVGGPDPILISGPRGCGKSTIFRWLSLKAHLHKPSTEFDQFRIAAFYISCSSDLQNRLSWVKTQALAERFRKEIVHYMNLLVAREILLTLCLIAEREDRESYWGLGRRQEQAVHSFFLRELRTSNPLLQGVSLLRQLLEAVESEMFDCHVQMLRGMNLAWTSPETFLGDFTALMRKEIAFFQSRPIAFLLDDFSTHRLPEPVQIILNRIIWERRATHIFKLSSEKYGASMRDSFDATADVAREMVVIDCGREYVALDDSDQAEKGRKFARDLLEHRLGAAKYEGNGETLLGHSLWPEGSLGSALRNRPEGRINDQYHGLECIADLCSGDVSTLLLVYRWIFEKAGVSKQTTSPVPKHIQHEAITSVSRELFGAIRYHSPHGPLMHSIVREFGNLVRRILREGKETKKEGGWVPTQCPRIEVDQETEAYEKLTPQLEEVAFELVRRAIFIEMHPGRARHRFAPSLRWQLRRVYLPACGAALAKNDAVKWNPSEFKYFLTDPKGACDREWQRRPKNDLPSTQTKLPLSGTAEGTDT